ncbi:histidine kinase [Microbacterium fluvii]|uniref:histidine kinase n=1 Tax=Microbacterium fluvii TaxID=415215 RepID=A0ABW2HFN0_9MICO|nr:histidine kinase [Microbacterium fluvii]MCU4673752.1 histidine kinase [Microbacterium fluvii]
MPTQPIGRLGETFDDAGVAPGALLRSRRSAWVFASVVFLTTVIQVLAVPITALAQSQGPWPLTVSIPAGFTLLVAGCALQAAALLLTPRWPGLAVSSVTAVYLALALGLGVPSWLIGMYLVIALSVFLLATRSSAVSAIGWAVGVVAISMSALLWWVLAIGTEASAALGYVSAEAVRFAAPVVGGAALGIWWAAQVRRVTLAREEAELARQEHDRRVGEAEERERARIAQELHDVAGQHLAGLITLADAALKIAPAHPEDAISLIEEVRAEGRFAAAGLTGALSDLRSNNIEPLETTKDIRRTPGLVEYWQKRGMTVQLEVTGTLSDLPAVVSTTAYRCIQESLTNAAKHAPGATVSVSIRLHPTALEVTVANGAPRNERREHPWPGLGWGLSGMRERLELLQGTLVARATPAGGWESAFTIPVAPTGRGDDRQ